VKHRTLGRTGLKVSEICLGTMTFGHQCDEATSRAILDRAADGGVDFLDTADCYPVPLTLETCGRTEEIVGRWLAGKRSDFIVATKCFFPTGPGPNDRGNSRRHILQAIDASLRRLNTDYVDLYQVHAFDNETPLEETLDALDSVVRAGKARYIGCSNFQAWHLGRALSVSRDRRVARFDCIQPRYNLLHRDIESDLLPLCQTEGVGVIVFNPLAGGLLTGKHKAGAPPANSGRFGANLGATATVYRERYWHQESLEAIQRLKTVFAKKAKTLSSTAVAWVLAQPGITAAIVGASSPAQVTETLGAAERSLDDEERATLDEVWYSLPRRRPAAGPVR
jgi:aryl-alcohol dehydrogenase-like predicted oxidoreductase